MVTLLTSTFQTSKLLTSIFCSIYVTMILIRSEIRILDMNIVKSYIASTNQNSLSIMSVSLLFSLRTIPNSKQLVVLKISDSKYLRIHKSSKISNPRDKKVMMIFPFHETGRANVRKGYFLWAPVSSSDPFELCRDVKEGLKRLLGE